MPTRGHYLKAVEAKNMCLVTHSSQKATQMFCHETKCIAKKEKYILSGQPSGCFSLCPDLRKSTTSIPPNPEYGIKPKLCGTKRNYIRRVIPHFSQGWLCIFVSRENPVIKELTSRFNFP